MPLVSMGGPGEGSGEATQSLLVFADGERAMGLMVEERGLVAREYENAELGYRWQSAPRSLAGVNIPQDLEALLVRK